MMNSYGLSTARFDGITFLELYACFVIYIQTTSAGRYDTEVKKWRTNIKKLFSHKMYSRFNALDVFHPVIKFHIEVRPWKIIIGHNVFDV